MFLFLFFLTQNYSPTRIPQIQWGNRMCLSMLFGMLQKKKKERKPVCCLKDYIAVDGPDRWSTVDF